MVLVAAGSSASIALVALLSWACGEALLAPPLGVTAFLCLAVPLVPSSCPRNVVLGHALGLASGWVALQLSGAMALPPALAGGFTTAHVASAAIAIFLTVLATEGLSLSHPPAGATTLIVALGVLRTPGQLAFVLLGAGAVAALAFLLLRAARVPYPAWAPPRPVGGAVTG